MAAPTEPRAPPARRGPQGAGPRRALPPTARAHWVEADPRLLLSRFDWLDAPGARRASSRLVRAPDRLETPRADWALRIADWPEGVGVRRRKRRRTRSACVLGPGAVTAASRPAPGTRTFPVPPPAAISVCGTGSGARSPRPRSQRQRRQGGVFNSLLERM